MRGSSRAVGAGERREERAERRAERSRFSFLARQKAGTESETRSRLRAASSRLGGGWHKEPGGFYCRLFVPPLLLCFLGQRDDAEVSARVGQQHPCGRYGSHPALLCPGKDPAPPVKL